MSKQKYYHSLDFFRGVCGYGVAITHLHAFIFESQLMEYFSLLFVEFFFVLSGFVLYPQLLKTINNKKNIILFFKRRWMRTLPLYLIIIILVSILTNNLFSNDFFKYLTFTQKFYPGFLTDDYYPVAWSLSIEEFFYILFPLILTCVNKGNFIKYTLILFLLLLISKIFFVKYFDSNFFRTGTLVRFDAILFGFLIAHFKENIIRFKKLVIFSFVSLLIIYILKNNYFILHSELGHTKYLFIILLQVLSALTMLLFIIHNRFFIGKKIKKLSLIVSRQTYSIYLMHILLIYILKHYNLSFLITNIIYFFSLIFLSSLIYNYIEKPILKLRPKLR